MHIHTLGATHIHNSDPHTYIHSDPNMYIYSDHTHMYTQIHTHTYKISKINLGRKKTTRKTAPEEQHPELASGPHTHVHRFACIATPKFTHN